jgi:hypothetical protein
MSRSICPKILFLFLSLKMLQLFFVPTTVRLCCESLDTFLRMCERNTLHLNPTLYFFIFWPLRSSPRTATARPFLRLPRALFFFHLKRNQVSPMDGGHSFFSHEKHTHGGTTCFCRQSNHRVTKCRQPYYH